jgi:deazaflavin-dependent oxidoreductase (nitroreductase family)
VHEANEETDMSGNTAIDWKALERHWNCRLTVRGRKSGQPRSVTIWYALRGETVLLTGGPDGPQWCRNLRANPDVEVKIGGQHLRGRARVVEDPADADAVRAVFRSRYLLARISRLFGGYTRSVPVVIDALAPA